MKKTKRTLVLLATALLILGGGISCSNSSSDDDDAIETVTTPSNSSNETEEEPVSVTSVWNFKEGANASANETITTYTTATCPTSEITITADTGSGGALYLLVQRVCGVKYDSGLQWSSYSNEIDVMRLTVDSDCTLTIQGKAVSDDSSSTNPHSFSVNKKQIYTCEDTSEATEQTWTVDLGKGTNTIAVSGMTFISFALSNDIS